MMLAGSLPSNRFALLRFMPARFDTYRGAIAGWLLLCAACVLAMVVIGGLTRLTDSGLSIVEWAPVKGALPPLSDASWLLLFEQYKTSPQYLHINRGMSLDEFQGIFWLEYVHRLFARITGFVVLLPLLYFAVKRALPAALFVRIGLIFALGGVQGAIGWYMVQSGLADIPEVSPFRLALHLGVAMLIFTGLVWTWLDMRTASRNTGNETVRSRLAFAFPVLVFVQVILGAFVAGNDAGLTYQTFPLMDGAVIPTGLYPHPHWWQNMAEDVLTVQFHHRMMAYALGAGALWLWWSLRKNTSHRSPLRRYANILLALFCAQFALGVMTLLHLEPWANATSLLPLMLASAHQANAVLLLGASLALCHALRSSPSSFPATGMA